MLLHLRILAGPSGVDGFRNSAFRGGIKFEEIIRALNHIGYQGPLSVEWEDSGMKREQGAKEALEFVRKMDIAPSQAAFDSVFEKKR